MNRNMKWVAAHAAMFVVCCAGLVAGVASAQTFEVLHSFGASGDGQVPSGGLAVDQAGNLYGPTYLGGTGGGEFCVPYGCGTVFQLVRQADGSWEENILHSFVGGDDGGFPTEPVVLDRRDIVYGPVGCATTDCGTQPGGTIYALTPSQQGTWAKSTIVTFDGSNGDANTGCWLTVASVGHIFGVCQDGGLQNLGLAFMLAHSSALNWYELPLHSFLGSLEGDTEKPDSPTVLDSTGKLYGTTSVGSSDGPGAVFEMKPNQGSSGWRESVLYNFTGGSDGGAPGGVVFGPDGNLYGAAHTGGVSGRGLIFKLTRNADRTWSYSTIYSFMNQVDGYQPYGTVIFDRAGNLYGVASGGAGCSCGVIYKLAPSGGQWTESVLYNFTNGSDGENPVSPLVLDAAGNLYGVTADGGLNGGGVAFEVTP